MSLYIVNLCKMFLFLIHINKFNANHIISWIFKNFSYPVYVSYCTHVVLSYKYLGFKGNETKEKCKRIYNNNFQCICKHHIMRQQFFKNIAPNVEGKGINRSNAINRSF